jgi:mevalonate pyrophosphate decarboxylase
MSIEAEGSDDTRLGSESRSRSIMGDGVEWHVREARYVIDRRSGTSLIFENESTIRRVRSFPADWYSLPDAELFLVSLNT